MAMPVDLRNQSFGKWLVLYKGQQTAHGQFWVCRCRCDPTVKGAFLASAAKVELVEAALLEGWTHSCGCDYLDPTGRHQPRRDLVGHQVGKRLVLRFHPGTRGPVPLDSSYSCRCICGAESVVRRPRLRPRCKSCAQSEVLGLRFPPLPAGPYGDLFIERRVRPANKGQASRYLVRLPNGARRVVSAQRLRDGTLAGLGTHFIIRDNINQVLAWLRAGTSMSECARKLRISASCVYSFFERHPDYDIRPFNPPPYPARGVVAAHLDLVLEWLAEGVSQTEICRRLGLRTSAVCNFLRRHPDIEARIASVPPDEC